MSDGLATVETIVMSSGPQAVDIKFDVGPEGERGSYFYVGTGSPDEYDFNKVYSQSYTTVELRGKLIYDKQPQEFDWYVNLDPGDETYLTVYQFKYPGQANPWEIVFKLIPNVVSKTITLNFGTTGSPTAGMAQMQFSVSDLELPLPQKFLGGSGIPEDAESVDSEAAMLALVFTTTPTQANPGYAYRTDKSAFYKTFSSDHASVEDWEQHLSISIDLDIENSYPIAKSFNVGMPTYDGSMYSFTIDITAANLDVTTTAWTPLAGTKVTHITLTVI